MGGLGRADLDWLFGGMKMVCGRQQQVSSRSLRHSGWSLRRAGWTLAIALAALSLGAPESRAQLAQASAPTVWEKSCNGATAPAERACFTMRGITKSELFAGMMVIQPAAGEALLRMTLPLNVQLKTGMRVLVDQHEPIVAAYVFCGKDGCIADHTGADAVVAQMKTGTSLTLQAIDLAGKVVEFVLPLADFAKVVESKGKTPEEQAKEFEQNLQRKADEFRKKMEAEEKAKRKR